MTKEELLKELEKHGKNVMIECNVQEIYVEITSGFSGNAVLTFKLIEYITLAFPKYPNVISANT